MIQQYVYIRREHRKNLFDSYCKLPNGIYVKVLSNSRLCYDVVLHVV